MSFTRNNSFVKIISKHLITIMLIIFTLSVIPISNVYGANNVKVTINASDINKMINNPSLCPSYITIEKNGNGVSVTTRENYGNEIEINMDQDINLYSLTIRYSPLSIIGNKQLKLVNCSVSKDFKVGSGSNIVFDKGGYIDITGNIYISGNVTLNDTNRWRTNKSFYLDGGTISGSANDGIIFTDTGSIYIQSGSIDVHTKKDGLYSEKDIEIYGGNIKIACENGEAVRAHYNIIFNGGYLEASTQTTVNSKACVCAGNKIELSSNCSITKPVNNKVGVYMDPWVCVMDSQGNKANSVIITGASHVHNYQIVPNSAKAATCTTKGKEADKICSICEYTVIGKEIPVLSHDFKEVPNSAIAATCTTAGKYADLKCSMCGITTTGATIPSSGHSYQYDYSSAVTPTCTADGKEADKVCSKCKNRVVGATKKATGHTVVIDPAVEATTTKTGLTEGSHCSKCGIVIKAQEIVPMKDNTCQHIWNSGVVTTEPKCLEAGVKTYTCTKCGGTKTEPINALGHNKVIDPYVAPTTTSNGLTEGCHCDRCNQVLVKQNIIPMLEKDPDPDPEPTPEQGGGTNPDVQPGDSDQNDQNKQNNQTNTQQNSSNNNQSNNKQNNNTNNNTTIKKPAVTTPKYSNEWVDGKWYDEFGNCTYDGILSWKSNASGWWVEDSVGWYPTDSWQKIDGAWYYFKPDGYMASEEYYKGYWLNSDGTMDDKYFLTWKSNASGWWVEDVSGWWPSNSWLKIDGYWYYFDGSGYMVTNQYVGGYWIGSDGICR
ncbi:MAG: carbohydrate-binding domain-containing protein [Eubacterium sp.]|nr:carbohydrate-binding domain-containing protein [Eubacterium sp.]